MANSNGTGRPSSIKVLDAIEATCDRCAHALALVVEVETTQAHMLCHRCRMMYPIAEVLMQLRRTARRISADR